MRGLMLIPFLCALAIAGAGPVSAQTEVAGPSLAVIAEVGSYMTVSLSTDALHFAVAGPPGVYGADVPVSVTVGCNAGTWSVSCAASALTSSNGSIGPERLFMGRQSAPDTPDQGGGLGFDTMDLKRMVTQGGPQAPQAVETLDFRILTKWEDRPGTYQGTITFTYLMTP
ncbi:MAG TPA: hypothetical protein VM221_03755 [Armatimonadota bacterium]|nr:hypothetical protein [Armatimonadota bacterium]